MYNVVSLSQPRPVGLVLTKLFFMYRTLCGLCSGVRSLEAIGIAWAIGSRETLRGFRPGRPLCGCAEGFRGFLASEPMCICTHERDTALQGGPESQHLA